MSNDIKGVQNKILEIMKYIDVICRDNSIQYSIMGGTALGAIRHGGFIPWDDDLDIFMTPAEYQRFRSAFLSIKSPQFFLQEWKIVPEYLEYAKVRMNGTTFIEENFKDRIDLHQGIYVDIMILHKVPQKSFIQKKVYFESKFVTLVALSQRGWKPKTQYQKLLLWIINHIPTQRISRLFYRNIYKYDGLKDKYFYCYWITPAKYKNGLFQRSFFDNVIDYKFEDTMLMGSPHIKEYLKFRYGDYMTLPSKEKQSASMHAMIIDTENDYSYYLPIK